MEARVVSMALDECFGFFVTGMAYGLLASGICFLVGLAICQCIKLISMAG